MRGDSARLLGAWELVSCEYVGDGPPVEPFGPNPIGALHYTPDRMFIILGANARGDTGPDHLTVTPEQAQAAMRSFAAYTGAWRLDEDNGVIYHEIELSWLPGMSGTEQRREYVLDGDRLTLKPPRRPYEGTERSPQVTWRRVPAAG